MKILVFTTIYPIKGTKTGFTPIVKYFCEDWVKQGHDVYVINSSSKFPLAFYLFPKFILRFLENILGFNLPNYFSRREVLIEENGVKIYQLPIKKMFPGAIISDTIINKNIKKIESKFLVDFKPEICVGHWVNPQIQYLSYFKKKYNATTALTLHSIPNNNEVKLIKRYINEIDNLGFRSEKLIQSTIEKLDVDNINYFLCHSGVRDFYNLSEMPFVSKQIKPKIIKICFIGNLISRKCPEVLLEATNQIIDVNFEIHYVGCGYMEKKLKNMKLKNHINVIFHGRLSRKEVYSVIGKCDLFVMLSKNETFGLVYLEAMLNRTIPIASLNEGFDGIIKHNYNGFLGNAGSTNDLLVILKHFISMNEEDIYIMQGKAFETAKLMTDEKMANNYLNNIVCKP